ncbi:hypothetical protein Cgig2_002185 [Carnegiea gigantea]|uniref:Aminotransferase-like plant mobile domain-containing protein n=1 Tax=Carnegiea gigantea TaxID=171969 RepID=A0A9Q1KV72_9CARY|nr:hypothetical protein Cgig2_002185 [Carnegiea gigantea]
MQGLFKMVTFMDKITSKRHYLHIQPSENDVDEEETKLPLRNPITFLCKSDCAKGPPSLPWWSTENLKTGETFLLSTQINMKENLPSYQLLCHDIESECKSWANYLFTAYHKLMQGRKGKLTIEQWIAFWFRGRNRYHVARKPDQDSQIPHPGILSSIIDTGAHGVASFMALGVGYCPPTAILTSIYKGLNEISRSSHLGRSGGHFPAHVLYAWSAKNFDVSKLVGEASFSPAMVKFNSIGQAKSFQLEEARKLIVVQNVHFLNLQSTCSDSKRKQNDLFDTKTSKDEGKLGSKPKLKIVRSGKPLDPSVPPMGDGSSRVKILGIDVVIPVMPIPAISIQSIAPLPQMRCLSEFVSQLPKRSRLVDLRGVCSLDDAEVESIRRVNAPSLVPHPQCPLRAPQGGIFVFNAEVIIRQVDKNTARVFGEFILDKVCRTPFDGLPSLKGDFDSLYATILQRGVDVTPLESKVAASEHLLQEAEREVIDLQGQIDILNATEVMDAATKASLEKAEAYIKEFFEDLKNFQWDP